MSLGDRWDKSINRLVATRRLLTHFSLTLLLLYTGGCVDQSEVQKGNMNYSKLPHLEEVVDSNQLSSKSRIKTSQETATSVDEQALSKKAPEASSRILISKTKRRLEYYRGGRLIRTYHIGLGSSPYGDKLQEGDGRTPEGKYTVVVKNPKSKFHLSLGLNYPNYTDATNALMDGRITLRQFNAINTALSKGEPPPWDTPLGGEIFIHGHGAYRDWTKGCIALENADVQELYAMVKVGTEVVIQP